MRETYPVHDWSFAVTLDGLRMVLGDLLGEGRDRAVYACRFDPSLVVKVDHRVADGSTERQNEAEWRLWQVVEEGATEPSGGRDKFRRIRRWLAPCVGLSDAGTFLVQRRTEPLPADYRLPRKMPRFLYDLKRSNFGLLDGRLVCHDYGIIAPVLLNNALLVALRDSVAHWAGE